MSMARIAIIGTSALLVHSRNILAEVKSENKHVHERSDKLGDIVHTTVGHINKGINLVNNCTKSARDRVKFVQSKVDSEIHDGSVILTRGITRASKKGEFISKHCETLVAVPLAGALSYAILNKARLRTKICIPFLVMGSVFCYFNPYVFPDSLQRAFKGKNVSQVTDDAKYRIRSKTDETVDVLVRSALGYPSRREEDEEALGRTEDEAQNGTSQDDQVIRD